jgi:hypothetical protein
MVSVVFAVGFKDPKYLSLMPWCRLRMGHRRRKADQLCQRNLQSLGQRNQHVQRHGIAGRLDSVNRGLGYIRHVGQRLLTPAPRLAQLTQVLPKGVQNHLIFHPGKLELKNNRYVITCDYILAFSSIFRPPL